MYSHILSGINLKRMSCGLLPVFLLAGAAAEVRAGVPLPANVLQMPSVSGNGQTAPAKAITREGGVVNTCLTSQDVSAELYDPNGVLLFSATRTLPSWGMWPWDLRNWRGSLGPDVLLKGYARFRGGENCLIGDSQSLDAKTSAASAMWSVAGGCDHHCKVFAVRFREDGKFKSELLFNYEPAAGEDTVSIRAFDTSGHEVAKVNLLHTPASGRYPVSSLALPNQLPLGTLLVELPTPGYVGATYTSADGTKKDEVTGWCIPPDHIPPEPCEGNSCRARLTLIKRVVNDNGGHAVPSDWALTATGPSPISGSSGSTAVTRAVVDIGTYTLRENGPAGYTAEGPFVCNGVAGNTVDLRAGSEVICTITNNDNPPPPVTLTCSPGSQTVSVGQPAVVSGDGGQCQRNYVWSATGGNPAAGSGPQFGTSYAAPGSHDVTVQCAGQTATCRVIVPDPPTPKARLTLIKRVVNDNGGQAVPSNWTLTATGPTPISGLSGSAAVTSAVVNIGTYTLSENGPAGYTAEGPFVCNGVAANTVNLRAGSEVTCTITNNDNPPPPDPPKCLSFTAQPAVITSGQTVTLTWNTSGATSGAIDHGVGQVALPIGSTTLRPTTDTTYTLSFSGPGGARSCTAGVAVQPATGGDQGCSPGYWKNHPGSWPATGYSTGQLYNLVFGVSDDPGLTLLDALNRGGGADRALGRHAVSALLNANHSGVRYNYTPAEVIALVRQAYLTRNFDAASNALEAEEDPCPLN